MSDYSELAEVIASRYDDLVGGGSSIELARDAADEIEALGYFKATSVVTVPRQRLEGWHNTPPLTGDDWRKFAESLPASEYATTLLFVADAMDAATALESTK